MKTITPVKLNRHPQDLWGRNQYSLADLAESLGPPSPFQTRPSRRNYPAGPPREFWIEEIPFDFADWGYTSA